MTKKEKESLVELLFEASDVLEGLDKTSCNLPPNYRTPLVDELYGFACMLRDENKENV